LPLWDRAQGLREAAAESRQAALKAQDEAQLDTAAMLSGLVAERTAWTAREKAYTERIVPLEEKVFLLQKDAFEKGKISGLQLLEAERSLCETKLAHAYARLMASVSGIQLEKLVLCTLPASDRPR